jgi:hypothetical protein
MRSAPFHCLLSGETTYVESKYGMEWASHVVSPLMSGNHSEYDVILLSSTRVERVELIDLSSSYTLARLNY